MIARVPTGSPLTYGRMAALRSYIEQTDPWLGEYSRARTENDIALMGELLLEAERAREALEQYGRHAGWCRFASGGGFDHPCTCGLDAALPEGTRG